MLGKIFNTHKNWMRVWINQQIVVLEIAITITEDNLKYITICYFPGTTKNFNYCITHKFYLVTDEDKIQAFEQIKKYLQLINQKYGIKINRHHFFQELEKALQKKVPHFAAWDKGINRNTGWDMISFYR